MLLEKAKYYIKNNYGKPLSVQDVADYLGRNPNYFSHIFKKEENISFVDYLNQIRIKQAQRLLTTTTLLTYEISEQVGYTDYRYFTQEEFISCFVIKMGDIFTAGTFSTHRKTAGISPVYPLPEKHNPNILGKPN